MITVQKQKGQKALAVALAMVFMVSVLGAVALPALASAEDANTLESPFKAVYNEVSQSIVGISISSQRQVVNGRIVSDSSFAGSGVVIKDGYVVTNYHVITGGGQTVADDISVLYNDEQHQANYVAGDEESDIAVLEVKDLTAPAVLIGDSDTLAIGDWALVIGNPLGEQFTNTLTVGIISGLNRDVSTSRSLGATSMIQTDAAINSGNSGGGLFNINGELVGITSQKISGLGFFGTPSVEGFGFAIPVNTVIKIANDLIDFGKVVYPRLGVSITTMTSPSDEPTEDYLPQSVWVRNVEKDSPAERAGIEVDDMIIKADGQRVKTNDELLKIVRSHEVGDTIELEIYRIPKLYSIKEDEPYPQGETLTLQVTLEALDEK